MLDPFLCRRLVRHTCGRKLVGGKLDHVNASKASHEVTDFRSRMSRLVFVVDINS